MIKIIVKRLMRNTIFSKGKNQKKKTFPEIYLSPVFYLFQQNSEFFSTATFLLYFYTFLYIQKYIVLNCLHCSWCVFKIFLSKLNALLQRVILSEFRCTHKNKYEH